MAMSKKDYELLARVLYITRRNANYILPANRTVVIQALDALADNLSAELARTNANFKKSVFLKKSGYKED